MLSSDSVPDGSGTVRRRSVSSGGRRISGHLSAGRMKVRTPRPTRALEGPVNCQIFTVTRFWPPTRPQRVTSFCLSSRGRILGRKRRGRSLVLAGPAWACHVAGSFPSSAGRLLRAIERVERAAAGPQPRRLVLGARRAGPSIGPATADARSALGGSGEGAPEPFEDRPGTPEARRRRRVPSPSALPVRERSGADVNERMGRSRPMGERATCA